MTELPDLPPPPDRDRATPPEGLERAVAVGRSRRNRFLGGAAGSTLAVVLGSTLLLGGGSSSDALLADDPEPTATATSSAAPAPSGEPTGQPSAASSPTAGSTGADPQTEPSADPEPSGGPTAAEPGQPDATPVQDERDEFTEEPRETSALTCGVSGDAVKAPGYGSASACGTASGGSSRVKQGGQVSATYGICVATGGDPLPLRFDAGREHEVRVFRDGRLVYRFSETVRYPQGAHTRTVPSGRCLEWTGTWDTSLADGSEAPTGGYRVRVSVEPAAVNGFETGDGDHGYLEFDVEVTS